MTSYRRTVPAVVAGALGFGAAAAWAGESTQQDLMSQIKALEAKVQALETQQTASTKDLNATIDQILRDAEKRSQMMAAGSGVTAGYDNSKFWIGSPDGSFLLRPSLLFQFRGVANFSENGKSQDRDTTDTGFEIARMKLEFDGNIFTPDFTYFFQFYTGEADGSEDGYMNLQDAWGRYMFADDWGFRFGQFKDPVYHEELTSDKFQMAVDRSMANEVIGGGLTGRVQGVSLIYGGYSPRNPLNVEVAVHDGFQSANSNYQDGDSYWGVGGRAEYKVTGDWKSYADFSARDNKNDLLVIGVGADMDEVPDAKYLVGTVDAQWENTSGLGIYAALLGAWTDPKDGGEDSSNWGAIVQAGYLLNPSWELYGRYSFVYFDNEVSAGPGGSDEDQFHEISVGVNYFMGKNGSWGHRAKITLEASYYPNSTPFDLDAADAIGSPGNQEVVVRCQFQLVI